MIRMSRCSEVKTTLNSLKIKVLVPLRKGSRKLKLAMDAVKVELLAIDRSKKLKNQMYLALPLAESVKKSKNLKKHIENWDLEVICKLNLCQGSC